MKFPVTSKPLALVMRDRRVDDGVSTFVTSPFGSRILNGQPDFHPGMDLHAPEGTQVLAPFAGVATHGFSDAGGNVVTIHHPSGWQANLDHLSTVLVQDGQDVSAGETVALSGHTGHVTGPHLHVELRPPPSPSGARSSLVDPAPFFFDGGGLGALLVIVAVAGAALSKLA